MTGAKMVGENRERYRWLAGVIKKGDRIMEGYGKTRLLLADDSVTIQRVVELTLPADRFSVTSVSDGDAALEAVRRDKPDVLLADVIMPGMDGYDLCAAIRSDPALCDLPVILLVGTFETYDERRGEDAGADAYLVKPFETKDLLDRIGRLPKREARLAQQAALPDKEAMAVSGYNAIEFESRDVTVDLSEDELAGGAVEAYATLSDITSEPVPRVMEVAHGAAEEGDDATLAGDEDFPWEEEMLPAEETPAAKPQGEVRGEQEEKAVCAQENVFSLDDFTESAILELNQDAKASGEIPADEMAALLSAMPWSMDEDAPAKDEGAPEIALVDAIEEIPAEFSEAGMTGKEHPIAEFEESQEVEDPRAHCQEEAVFAADVSPVEPGSIMEEAGEIPPLPKEISVTPLPEEPALVEKQASPAAPAVSADMLGAMGDRIADTLRQAVTDALDSRIELSVRQAVADVFGGIFRDAIEKAAKDVVPAMVEKAVREELKRQQG